MKLRIEYDDVKEQANLAKHGISLRRAADLTATVERTDVRRNYGEVRIVVMGLTDGRVHVCIYTPRGEGNRIISLRKANGREVNEYRSAKRG